MRGLLRRGLFRREGRGGTAYGLTRGGGRVTSKEQRLQEPAGRGGGEAPGREGLGKADLEGLSRGRTWSDLEDLFAAVMGKDCRG